MADGYRFDLVDGSLVERDTGSISSWVGGVLYAQLLAYCRGQRVGWAWHADAGFDCFTRQRTVRFPDVSVVRYGRLPGEQLPDGHIKVAPDFVAEIVSPNDLAEDLEDKLQDYRSAGVRLVWVIYPAVGTARVHRLDRRVTEVSADEFLDGEDVLPGFRVRVADLLPVPPAPSAEAPAPQAPSA
jgi:Uma2 family endonuclease